MTEDNENKRVSKELKELVVTRLEAMPPNFKLSIGSETMSRDKMIEHVKKGDPQGEQIIGLQLNFIKALTTGKLLETLNAYS